MIIINTKRHSLVRISVFFKKAKFTLLKFIDFHSKELTKQILVFYRKMLQISVIWEKFSAT